jgi:colanic acid biosynthesis glycosyl transferase WcaI
LKLIFLNRFFFPDHSATSQILSDLAFGLAGDGQAIHVITSRQCIDERKVRLQAEEQVSGVVIHRVWTTRFGRANLLGRAIDYVTFYISAGTKLWNLARPGDIVVAKTDPPMISVIAAWVARRRSAILVNWFQDVFPEIAQRLGLRGFKGTLGRIALKLRNYSLNIASANVVLGSRMAEYVSTLPGARQVTIIENWSDGALVRPIPRAANEFRREWGLDNRFVVGYSGNMGRAHEFETILRACELLRSQTEVIFLFIGEGRQRKWIHEEVARRGLGNVMFRPYQARESLALSLGASDLHLVTLQPSMEGLIVPSKYYGIAAAGRPVIFVGDIDGEIARALTRDECGVAIGTGDSSGLASAIQEMHANADETERMGARARLAFERLYDRPVGLLNWTALLRNISTATKG